MFKKTLLIFLVTMLVAQPSVAALTVHSAPPLEVRSPLPSSLNPEDQLVNGRARSQRLEDAMKVLTKKKMDVEFTDPAVKDMSVNWRSNSEPLQIVLTKLSRGYGLDIVLNEPKETIYVSFDTGRCDAHREAQLRNTKRMWESMNIKDRPVLPPRLAIMISESGHEYRLC